MKKKVLSLIIACTTMIGALSGCGASASGSTEKDSYTVGICQLVQHPALDSATQGFKDALTEKLGDKVTFDEQNAAGDSATCATIANSFVTQNYDLILANATPALQAASAATADIPIVGTSVTDYATALALSDWTGTTGMNVTGTCDLAPLDKQADMVKELFPDAVNVGIIYCSAEANSKYQADTITTYLEKLGFTVTAYTFADSNDVAAVTQNACDASDVLFVPTDNTAANCAENINNVALPSGTPIVAGEKGICSGCGIATLSIDYYDIGYAAGEMAYQILAEGKDPASMQIGTAKEVTKMYNEAIATALGVSIPSDYEVITED